MTTYRTKRDLITSVIGPDDVVLDVGFAGQAITPDSTDYPHALLKSRAKTVYGVDLRLPEGFSGENYQEASAENFSFDVKFDVIVALDVIEHLSNPGLFLDQCRKHLATNGKLVLTTPNAFNLFSLIEKLTHDEPNVNKDHTFYFNKPTIQVLLRKNGWEVESFGYIYDMLGSLWAGGLKRKIAASIYATFAAMTPKFDSTLVIVARPD